MNFPHVVGMRQDVFWLDHQNLEDQGHTDKQQRSHSNQWEVGMVAALVRHLVRQGEYTSNDIAVLTPYTGQVVQLRDFLRNDFEIVLSERDHDILAQEGLTGDVDASENQHTSDGVEVVQTVERKKLSDLLRYVSFSLLSGNTVVLPFGFSDMRYRTFP